MATPGTDTRAGPDQVGRQVVDVGRRHVVGGDLQIEHRDGRRVEHQDLGRRDPGRKLLEHGLRDGRDLRLRGRHVGSGLEEDLDDAAAVERLALDVLDVADGRGQGALIVIDDAARHVGGHQPVIGPDHRHDRDLDGREDVGRGLEHRHHAEQQNQDREYNEGIGPLQSGDDDSIHLGLTAFPSMLCACIRLDLIVTLGLPDEASSSAMWMRPKFLVIFARCQPAPKLMKDQSNKR